MRRDNRPFIKIYVDMPRHPKFAGLSKAQKWTIVEAMCHCGEYLTDGVVDLATWRKAATKRDRDAILATGVAVEFRRGAIVQIPNGFQQDSDEIRAEFEARTTRVLPSDCVLFLGYSEEQNKRIDVEEMQEKRRSAGSKGGRAKAQNAADRGSGGVASATANGNQTGSKNVPEYKDKDKEPTYVGSKDTPSTASQPAPKLSAAEPEGFPEFWGAYPRRTDKGGARKAYAKAIARTDPADILAGAQRFAADPNLPEPQFIPHASTWLNNERWSDDPLPARSRPSRVDEPGPVLGPALTPAQFKFAQAEALKDNPNPNILAAAGLPIPPHVAHLLDAPTATVTPIGAAS